MSEHQNQPTAWEPAIPVLMDIRERLGTIEAKLDTLKRDDTTTWQEVDAHRRRLDASDLWKTRINMIVGACATVAGTVSMWALGLLTHLPVLGHLFESNAK